MTDQKDNEVVEKVKNMVIFKTPLTDKEMGGLEIGWFGTALLFLFGLAIIGLLIFTMWKG